MTKIFLIGYMGSGKSTVGKKMATKLQMDFIDLDALIEAEYQQKIPDIFKQEGEEAFRIKENNILKKVILKNNCVIACGGGAPCFYNNIELMNEHGITIYLKLSINTIVNRLLNAKDERPLISGKTEKELKSFVMEQLEKREDFYSKAKYTVKAKDLDLEALITFLQKEISLPATV